MSSNIPVPHMPNHTAPDADEIDLFELMQTLWQEKLLIILLTLVCAGAAAAYAFTATPQYSIAMTLKPASLSLYGEFVAGIQGEQQKSIALGRETAEEVLVKLTSNLELRANQVSILNDPNILNVKVVAKKSKQSVPELEEVSLELTTLQAGSAAQTLKSYVDAVSVITLKELNSFVQGLGNPTAITQEMLYTIDSMPSQASLVKPKKSLIVALGIVLGGMLGVFAALIRSMIRKRKNAI